MTAVATPADERILALREFGYSEGEAAFLCLAALQGGYFLRRQVAQFFKCQDGAAVTRLAQRVLNLEHGQSTTWKQNTQLYHLCARPLYEALGEPDNRNRRHHEWNQIKNRIMGLDFVLAHQDAQYLATEREKLDYFTGTLKIALTRLPAKRYRSADDRDFTTRYFVDKYPLFVTPAARNEGFNRVSFCFVDEGLIGLSRFENFLAAYRAVFEALPAFQLIYVATRDAHFASARARFERFRTPEAAAGDTGLSSDLQELLTYFRLRQLYEQREYARLDRAQLIRLRDAREALANAKTEALYATWKTLGDHGLRAQLDGHSTAPAFHHGSFSTERLNHDYALFGTAWPR